MARFYSINFDETLYLTSDGSAEGIPCKLEVPGVEDLLTTVAGQVEISADGTPVFQTLPWGTGKSFEIQIFQLTEDVWEDVKDLLLNALQENEAITISGTGDLGDFEVEALPDPIKPFLAERFINSRIINITLRFITI